MSVLKVGCCKSSIIISICAVLFMLSYDTATNYVYAGQSIVINKGKQFSDMFLKLDDTNKIQIINRDISIHKLTFENVKSAKLVREIAPGRSVFVILPNSGVYDVRCNHHPNMKLTVFVPRHITIANVDSQYRLLLKGQEPAGLRESQRGEWEIEATIRPFEANRGPILLLKEQENDRIVGRFSTAAVNSS